MVKKSSFIKNNLRFLFSVSLVIAGIIIFMMKGLIQNQLSPLHRSIYLNKENISVLQTDVTYLKEEYKNYSENNLQLLEKIYEVVQSK